MGPTLYTANFDATAFSTATDLFEITPVASVNVIVYGISLLQTTDLGDAAEEVLRIGLYRDCTAGSGGTALTEVIYNNAGSGGAVTAAVRSGGTSSSAGTLIDIIGWNIRIPLLWIPVPEMRPKFSNLAAEGPTSSFRLIAAPTDAITVSGCIYWEEI